MERIGLIAGNKKFPLIFADAARKKNVSVVAVAIKKDTSRALTKLVDKIYWLHLGEFEKLFEIFKKEGVSKVVMAGQISPYRLFSREVRLNPELQNILQSIKDQRADSIFGAIAQRLSAHGLTLLSSTTFIEEYLPGKGALTSVAMDAKAWEDVSFGLALAKEIAALDIGQTVAVKHKAIVAVEALEGTDNLIRRAGKIARAGVTIVKVSKPKQDERFDIPVVGLTTVKNLIRARAACLAVEAGKTLFIDKEASIALAQKKKIAIVAV
ncbi:MAG: UDP-2,3-diacylglucosamine diphosphatase LpxI [Candidatus Omnitrophica bacterium]|nr:UDP-2,3-diacylglucosamine diphosphatase LpxI [Candidatus Omnitrophota bacterium]